MDSDISLRGRSTVLDKALSEAGSILSERMESATQMAVELLRVPLRCVAAGTVCLVLPPVVLMMTPFILLLIPLLVPLGFILTLIGIIHTGYIVCVAREQEDGVQPLFMLTTAVGESFRSKADLGRLNHAEERTDRGSGERRSRSRSLGVKSPLLETSVSGVSGEAAWDPTTPSNGTLKELNALATNRGQTAFKQLGRLLHGSVTQAARDMTGELEQHLRALQRELQSWAGLNPNLKPYAQGHIGWLLQQEAPPDTSGGRGVEGGNPNSRADHTDVRAGINSRAAQRHDLSSHLNFTSSFEKLLNKLPRPEECLSGEGLAMLPLPEGMQWTDLGYLLIPGLLTKWYPLYMGQVSP